jgi:hypothetical protein
MVYADDTFMRGDVSPGVQGGRHEVDPSQLAERVRELEGVLRVCVIALEGIERRHGHRSDGDTWRAVKALATARAAMEKSDENDV